MMKNQTNSTAAAEVIGLRALTFLAADGERLQRFLDLSGLTPEAIRRDAAKPTFLAGVLDHLLADQTLLLLFAEGEGLAPEAIQRARMVLPGARHDF